VVTPDNSPKALVVDDAMTDCAISPDSNGLMSHAFETPIHRIGLLLDGDKEVCDNTTLMTTIMDGIDVTWLRRCASDLLSYFTAENKGYQLFLPLGTAKPCYSLKPSHF
jgi:hypothetical protein